MNIPRAAALASAFALALALAPVPPAEAGELLVEGVGEVAATPDMATIRIGVETREREAADALAENNSQAAKIIAAAKAAGVEARDIQTSNLSVYPQYEAGTQGQPRGDDPPRLVAFVVSNEVQIRIRDLDGMGALLTGLVDAGANQMGSVAFAVDDDAALLQEARKRAVADARAKAEAIADAAGLGLGPILSIEESGLSDGPRPRASYRMSAEAVPVEAGEMVISAGVRIVWAIAE